MDGGGVMSLFTLTVLRRIEDKFPGFIQRTDALAGTSAGGMNALLMARFENPVEGLCDAFELWGGDVPIYDTTALRKFGALVGEKATYGNTILKKFLVGKLGDLRLKDLYHRVAAVTVQLDNKLPDGTNSWMPKVFDSDGGDNPDDTEALAVDVALATGAFPITFPVYQGHVDGGVVANNPALCLLINEIKVFRRKNLKVDGLDTDDLNDMRSKLGRSMKSLFPGGITEEPSTAEMLSGIRMLSIGSGMRGSAIPGSNLDWGYRQWLFQPGHLGLFTDLIMTAPMELASEQCHFLLGEKGFWRLNPVPLTKTGVSNSGGKKGGPIDQVRQASIELGKSVSLFDTFRWIEESGWMDSPKEARATTEPEPRTHRRPAAAKSGRTK
jgi:hypothetical protein